MLSPITGSFNTERLTFQQPAGGPVHYPTVRMDYNLTSAHRVTGTWYRQRFTDKGFDTTNTRQPTWPDFPLYGTQGSCREAYTSGLRSSFGQSLVNDARVAYSGAPVEFGPYHERSMYNGTLANQGGFSLGINAGCGNNCSVGITSAGPSFTPSARNATTLNISNTLTWLKGSHSLSMGGEFGQYDVWLDNYGSRAVPSITFGTATGDPALAMFSATNFPGSSATARNQAAALYAVLTGRVTSDHRQRPADAARRVRLPRRQPRGRPASSVGPLHPGQLAHAPEPVGEPRAALRDAAAVLRAQQQLLHGVGRRHLGHLRVQAGLRHEQPDARRPATSSSPGR